MLYRFSRYQALRRNFISGFGFGDVALFISVSISKPHFVQLRYNYFWFRKTNVRHIGILLPVSILPYHRSRHVTVHQSAKFHPNRTANGRELTSCRVKSRGAVESYIVTTILILFTILDFKGPIMGSVKSPCRTSSIQSVYKSNQTNFQ